MVPAKTRVLMRLVDGEGIAGESKMEMVEAVLKGAGGGREGETKAGGWVEMGTEQEGTGTMAGRPDGTIGTVMMADVTVETVTDVTGETVTVPTRPDSAEKISHPLLLGLPLSAGDGGRETPVGG